MATGYELIYDIKERLGLNSDDARFSNEYIMFQIEKARTALIKRNFSRRYREIPNSLKQHIQLDLEIVNDNEFGDEDSILQTVDVLPVMIESSTMTLATQIDGGSYTDLKFIQIPIERFPYAGEDFFFPTIIYCTVDYDYRLKFKSLFNKYKLLSKVRVQSIFMHPEEAWKHHPDYDPSVDYWNLEYPMDSETLFEVSNVVVQQLAPSLPEDKINNGDDDPIKFNQ